MAHSELLATVRRPLSPDTQKEAPATRSEYERVQDILEEDDAKFPSLQYDGVRKVAIVSAAPSPLHCDMVGQMLSKIADKVKLMPGLDANIKRGLFSAHDSRNYTDTGDTSTTRNWDVGVAVQVGLSQTYASLRAAISFSVCALRCRIGIALCINEGNRDTTPTTRYYGTREDTWFGEVASVVLEIYRLEDETLAPETLLDPTQSFMIVEDGLFVGGEVPPNLAEISLGDCITTHILSGDNIEATPVNFFHQDWFEDIFRFAMLRTAMERIEKKCKVQRV
ncbi:hypothetical protein V1519DRAFT_463132 [Lipomyces tetrasporus]